MRNLKDEIISAGDIAKEFKLSDEVASEIVAEETRKALNRNWQTWALFLCGISISGFIYFNNHQNRTSALLIFVFTTFFWLFLGRYLARSAIRSAARVKSERIHSSHT